jgi:hypothetical protein
MLSSYKDCPRKYYLRHILNWRSAGTSLPLTFGLAWHAAMDVVWQHAKQLSERELPEYALAKFLETWEEQGLNAQLGLEEIEKMLPRTPSVALEMLRAYVNTRGRMLQEAEVLAVEQPFAVPLPSMLDVWYVGKLDKIVRYNGQLLVLEHKTTTAYKKDGGFQTAYVEGWFSDSQVKGYQFGGALFFPGLKQVWVDAALVHKQVHNAFRFVPVEHGAPLLQEWIDDTRDWIGRVQRDYARGYFPKNENSCMGKFGACPYLDICRTTPKPQDLKAPPEGYLEERWEPFDLLGLDKLVNKETGNE